MGIVKKWNLKHTFCEYTIQVNMNRENILYPNLFHLSAVGGVPVWEQAAAAGEQRTQVGAADNQDPARARRPGRQEEEIFFSRWILQLALF